MRYTATTIDVSQAFSFSDNNDHNASSCPYDVELAEVIWDLVLASAFTKRLPRSTGVFFAGLALTTSGNCVVFREAWT